MTRISILVVLVVIAGIVAAFALRGRAGSESKASADPKRSGIESLGNEAVERAKRDVKRVGWHMVAVRGEGSSPGFVFTIGLWKSYHHPELLLFAPGDPLEVSGRVAAMAKRIAAGETFAAGKTYDGLFGKFSGALRKVNSSWYVEFVGTAMAFYQTDDFPVLQVVWPDKEALFPWQSGFDPNLFGAQPLLYETNLVLANVSREARARFVAEKGGPEALRASWAELFVELPAEQREAALADWRWLVGPDAKLFRVTVFGDLFLQTPDGHIHWLDTGSARYEEFVDTEAESLEGIAIHLPTVFHVSTLLALRDLGFRPQAGQVYSWQHAPMLGGEGKVTNFDTVSAMVHISHLGQVALSIKDVPPGTMISGYDFAPLGPAGTYTSESAPRFQVVINGEEQYSIWPEGEKIPDGWKGVDKTGTQKECLAYIKEVWVDMRPLSLRKAMAAQEKENPHDNP